MEYCRIPIVNMATVTYEYHVSDNRPMARKTISDSVVNYMQVKKRCSIDSGLCMRVCFKERDNRTIVKVAQRFDIIDYAIVRYGEKRYILLCGDWKIKLVYDSKRHHCKKSTYRCRRKSIVEEMACGIGSKEDIRKIIVTGRMESIWQVSEYQFFLESRVRFTIF